MSSSLSWSSCGVEIFVKTQKRKEGKGFGGGWGERGRILARGSIHPPFLELIGKEVTHVLFDPRRLEHEFDAAGHLFLVREQGVESTEGSPDEEDGLPPVTP